jgi:hypothetical protein
MSETLIREIAQQVLRDQVLLNWRFYLIMLAIFILSTALSTFIVTYIRKRAETYATKADFEQLINQLRATTEATEQVRTTISHLDWTVRESKTLRRIKLEELVAAMYELREWLDEEMDVRIFGGSKKSGASPIWKLELVSRLYFPELMIEINNLTVVYISYTKWLVQTQGDLLAAGSDLVKRQAVLDAVLANFSSHHERLIDAISAIEPKASAIMKEIIGI